MYRTARTSKDKLATYQTPPDACRFMCMPMHAGSKVRSGSHKQLRRDTSFAGQQQLPQMHSSIVLQCINIYTITRSTYIYMVCTRRKNQDAYVSAFPQRKLLVAC